jgi:uncharacterized protein YjbI with pentapeptide repeats
MQSKKRDEKGLCVSENVSACRNYNGKSLNLRGLPLARLQGSIGKYNYTEEQRQSAMIKIDGAFLRDTHLEDAFLSGITLQNVFLRNAYLQEANLSGSKLLNVKMRSARFTGADLSYIHLENSFLPSANFIDANLSEAKFIDVDATSSRFNKARLIGIRLERVDLQNANFEEVVLTDATLKEVNLEKAQFQGADLSGSQLDAIKLGEVILSNKKHIGSVLADMQWEHTNLSIIDWSQIKILGDEDEACQKYGKDGDYNYLKSKSSRLIEYQRAVRANRQLAVTLRDQGLNEEADRFAYRAQRLQQEIRRRQHKYLKYIGSCILWLLAGYGYRPGRSVLWYLAVIFGFALAYHFLGRLSLYPPDAFIFSVMSFHGRGFFPSLNQETNLHNPLVMLAAAEAIIGLLIEISFIATFTQRFFGR